MIYLFTALYAEADLFIKKYHLEKNLENTRFQEFYQEEYGIRLTITGVGEIAAASAVSSVCSIYKPMKGDILLNIGTCAHLAGKEGVFLCNKIIEQATGKTFYPDLLYRHTLQEETIVTGMQPYNQEEHIRHGNLYDMEAAAIYQAGSYFFAPHQICQLYTS
ncbi:MAG: spore photoproduct, partial [Lachnospiraceae bacterium]|nr:spore photoproduct [Lachnospiraceae bacterium]